MDRRNFLGMLKNVGLAGAVGIPLLGAKSAIEGDMVDVTFRQETVDKLGGYRLFVDPSAGRLGVVFRHKSGLFLKDGDISQIELSKVLEAVRDGARPEVRLENVAPDGRCHTGDVGRLYVDRGADEFGIYATDGTIEQKVSVPLSSVVRLLRKAEVL